MKKFIKTFALLSVTAAIHANATAAISVDDTNETSFEISGTILPECKVNNSTVSGATDLNLASTTAQDVATVEIWCNTGQSTANTTYESLNGGVLKNNTHDGQDIAYLLDISGTQDGVDLSTSQTLAQGAGSDTAGTSVARTLAIRPQVTGFEYEGSYTDTISITVSYE